MTPSRAGLLRRRRTTSGRVSAPAKFVGLPGLLVLAIGLWFVAGDSRAERPEVALLERDFPTLMETVGTAEPADFVIVVDRSGSMKPLWPVVKEALNSFVRALPEGDYVSIVSFGTEAGYLATPAPVSAQSVEEITRAVSAARAPTDSHTDLGLAFEKALDELNRPGGSRLKFVFFLTDFQHDPPPGSRYRGRPSVTGDVWNALSIRRKNELEGKIVEPYALLLPLGGEVGRDFEVGRLVFPNIREVAVRGRETFLAWFERRKAEVLREKLRARVRDDLAKSPVDIIAVRSPWTLLGSSTEVAAVVRRREDRLVKVSGLSDVEGTIQADTTDVVLEIERIAQIDLKGGDAEFPVATVRFPSEPTMRRRHSVRMTGALRGTQDIVPIDEVRRLLSSDEEGYSPRFELSVESPVSLSNGRIDWVWIALGATLVGLAAGTVVYRMRPEYLEGELSGGGIGSYRILRRERRRSLLIGVEPGEGGIPVKGVSWRVELRGLRQREQGCGTRGVYARIASGDARGRITTDLGNEHLGLQWVRVPKGARVQVEGRTFTWA